MTSAAILHGKKERMRSNIDPNLNAPTLDDKPRRGWLFGLVLLALLPGCAAPGLRVKNTMRTFDTVVIDAGHGGHDDGAKSRWGGKEKHHALSVSQKLRSKLASAGFKTVMTRNSDRFVELNDRARISNRQDNAIFVSVHFNHSPKRGIRGGEVYYRSSVSRPLAQRILAKIDAIPGRSVRYVKTANFRVLKLNRYPAVLVECGYLSHRSEGAICAGSKHHDHLARAIASAIVEIRGPLKRTTAKEEENTSPAPGTAPAEKKS
jgi:N-acetylmuramoyl-L-alanine amidase